MSQIVIEIVFIVVLVLLNGLFSMSEMAVVAARKTRLQQLSNEGQTQAQTALDLAEAPNQFLSTVQIGITLVGVLAGAFGGATLAEWLAGQVEKIDGLAPYSDALGLGLVVMLITYLSLVIGELVPKRLALQSPEKIAMTVAGPMRWLSRVAFPLERLLSFSSNAVVRLLGVKPSEDPGVTEDDIRILMQEGTEAGVFLEAEQHMIRSVFRLNDQHVSALMTPRTEIIWLDVDDSRDEIRTKATDSVYSAFPVCRGSLDNLVGIVRARDLLLHCLSDGPSNLEGLSEKPPFVPENATASNIVELFKQTRSYTVMVVDEYGGIQGMVTAYDILEAIVGDLQGGLNEAQAVQREDGSWLMDGMTQIDKLKEVLGIRLFPGEERGAYETLGGFVMSELGEIPSSGKHFQWAGFRFEVVDMDGLRVDKVLIEREKDKIAVDETKSDV